MNKHLRYTILLGLFYFLVRGVFGQTILLQESFETDGEGTRYTSNSGNTIPTGGNDIWDRTDQNPAPNHSTMIMTGTRDGSWYWAGEAVSDLALNGGADGFIELNALNVAGYSSLDVQLAIGISRFGQNRWERDDVLRVEYNMDNGGWNLAGLFRGNDPTSATSGGGLAQETDNDESTYGPYGAEVTDTFADFTLSIPVTGSSLSVRVTGAFLGSEEVGFDNIRIRGILSNNDAPVLTGIETTSLAFTEGDPPLQVTNTLTISDNDNANLSGATIQISTGFDTSEDQLSYTGMTGISGSWDQLTGILVLTGSASLADYQRVLRSVTYINFDQVDASSATRTISFLVNDGTDNSNFQTRDITISTALNPNPLPLPFCESFEVNGEGVRYESNNFVDGCNFAERGLAGTDADGCYAEILTGADGSWVFLTEDTDANGGFTLTSQDYDISTLGFAELSLEVLLAVSRDDETRWEYDDQFRIEYRIDNGPFEILGLFRGNNVDSVLGSPLYQDLDQDITTYGPFSTSPVPDVFTNYSFTFQGSGSVLNYRIVVLSNGTEELAFDNICLSGTTLCTSDTTELTATACDSSQVGTTEVLLTGSSGCDSLVITVTTLDTPPDAGQDVMISLVEGDSVDLDTVVTVAGGNYSINGNAISNIFNTSGLGDTVITVSYTVASSNTCPDAVASIEITVSRDATSIEKELLRSIKIYPNPARDILMVELEEPNSHSIQIDVLNLMGTQIQGTAIKVGRNMQQLDISNLASGIYIIRLGLGEESSYLRFHKLN